MIVSTILSNYKTEAMCAYYGYMIAHKEKQMRWGRYADSIYTSPFYAIIGIGIGYTVKHIPDILNKINIV